MDLHLDRNPMFQKTLANLIFSANNPFQSNIQFVVDQFYQEQNSHKQKVNYANSTSISYLIN